MTQLVSMVLLSIGVAFMLMAAIGVVRLPDFYMRMHSSSKSATLGVSCVMLGAAVHFGDITVSGKAAATIVFVMVTAPVGAHVLARAAYFAGVPLWKGTLSDELRGRYDSKTHELSSSGQPPAPDSREEE